MSVRTKTTAGLAVPSIAILVLSCACSSSSTPATSAATPASPPSTPSPTAPAATPSPTAPAEMTVGSTIDLTGFEDLQNGSDRAEGSGSGRAERPGIFGPEKGQRWVAVRVRLKNISSSTYDDSPDNGARVIDTKGQQFDTTITTGITAGALFPGNVKIRPGSAAVGFMVFEVPKTAKLVTLQFGLDSGFADDFGEWEIS